MLAWSHGDGGGPEPDALAEGMHVSAISSPNRNVSDTRLTDPREKIPASA